MPEEEREHRGLYEKKMEWIGRIFIYLFLDTHTLLSHEEQTTVLSSGKITQEDNA